MDTETQEQTTTVEEEASDTSSATENEETTSEQKENVSEETTNDSPKYSESEFEVKVQSAKDKELTPLYKERDDLKTENAKLKQDGEYKHEDARLSRLEGAEKEAWDTATEGEIKDIHDVRKETVKLARQVHQENAKNQSTAESLNAIERAQKARDTYIQHSLPDGDELISKMKIFVDACAEAETQRELDEIAKRLLRDLPGKKMQNKKMSPDSGKKADGDITVENKNRSAKDLLLAGEKKSSEARQK